MTLCTGILFDKLSMLMLPSLFYCVTYSILCRFNTVAKGDA